MPSSFVNDAVGDSMVQLVRHLANMFGQLDEVSSVQYNKDVLRVVVSVLDICCEC